MQTIPLSKSFSLPLDVASRRSCIFGVSGSGKSNTATVIVEGLVKAGEQVVLIDPKGEGWGLTSSATGKSEGLDVIVFGQPHGHIERLDESHGETLADFVVDSGQSVVLSLLGFDTDQAERRFVAKFFKRLYRRKSTQQQRTRTLVVLEEAHLFVPESGQMSGDKAELIGSIQRCVRQGRSFGLGSLLVDQRPQDVSKRLVSQAELLVVHQLGHNTDRKALKEWTDGYGSAAEQADLLDNLAQLQPGEAFVWSPAWLRLFERVKIARRTTFDSGATPDGSAASQPTKRTKVDLEKLRGKLTEVVERAKADDPAELRRQIAELKKRIGARGAGSGKAEVAAIAEREVSKAIAERDKFWRGELAKVERNRTQLVGRLGKIEQLAHVNGDAQVAIATPPAVVPGQVETRRPSGTAKVPRLPPAERPERVSPTGDGTITARQQRFLDVATTLAVLGAEVTRETVCGWLGIHPRGGSVGEELKALVDGGWIDVDRGRITVTEAGVEQAATLDPSAAIDSAKSGLTPRQTKFFEAIVAVYPESTTREEIARGFSLHPRGGSLGEDLSRLVGRGLVEANRGEYRARDFLFAGT